MTSSSVTAVGRLYIQKQNMAAGQGRCVRVCVGGGRGQSCLHHHRGASRRRAVCAPRTVRKSITRAPDRSPIERSAMAQSLFFFVRRRMRMPSDAAVLCVGSSPPCALRLVRRPLPLEVPVAWSALASAASMAARLLPLPPPIIARIRQRGRSRVLCAGFGTTSAKRNTYLVYWSILLFY